MNGRLDAEKAYYKPREQVLLFRICAMNITRHARRNDAKNIEVNYPEIGLWA
jgi:hypothetical protein